MELYYTNTLKLKKIAQGYRTVRMWYVCLALRNVNQNITNTQNQRFILSRKKILLLYVLFPRYKNVESSNQNNLS